MRRIKLPTVSSYFIFLLMLFSQAYALEAMSESEMSSVQGRDGVTVNFNGAGVTADQFSIQVDTPTAGQAEGLYLNTLNLTQTGTADNWLTTKVDVGSDVSGDAYLSIDSRLDISRFSFNSMTLSDSSRSFGEWALVGGMDFRMVNRGLFFDDTTNKPASLYFALTDAKWFYRQNWYYHANLTFDNLDFVWDMPEGSIGITNEGLRIFGDVNYLLNFDLLYKFHPDQDMATVTANDKRMLNFGWEGTLYDTELVVRGGGIWDGTEVGGAYDTSARTQGLNFGVGWNYKKNQGDTVKPTDLRWQIGQGGGEQVLLEFGDWINLHNGATRVPLGFDFPNITFDVVTAGNGPGGLCWGEGTHGSGCGAKMLGFDVGTIRGYSAAVNRTGSGALMAAIRDGNLLAYSNQVTVSSNTMAPETYNWGLIYTLANIDANIAMYPGGSLSHVASNSENQGFMIDLLLMTQTLDGSGYQGENWAKGTHFMIADTDPAVNMGIGLLNANFLLAADDLRVWLKNTPADSYASAYAGGIDLLSPRARMQLSAEFAGVALPDGSDKVHVADVDLNLEGGINFRLSPPPPGENYLAYSAAMRLYPLSDTVDSVLASGGGSYWSISEPGRPGVELRLANIVGDLAIVDSKIELYERNHGGNGESPELEISNKIVFGGSAAARLGDGISGLTPAPTDLGQVVSSDVYFGSDRLGQLVIPNGSIRTTIGLLPQE
ncbi:hypothetical protein [Alcanivorax sp. DP30]|uniref:hypothetical protein n=1 Tax=Alcanivorax sp. DP30 TaxID=2606217 RepID=UPI0013706F59|nr:hypothetical protein [Alcanivorax sp. DP30]MZR63071.1 hypothetical protein [Alcanivorax sp. DP30]